MKVKSTDDKFNGLPVDFDSLPLSFFSTGQNENPNTKISSRIKPNDATIDESVDFIASEYKALVDKINKSYEI